VTSDLIALIKIVMLLHKTQAKHSHLEVLVLCPSSFLASVGVVELTFDAKGKARLAIVAMGPVSEQARSSKALLHQVRVNIAVDQMTWGGHLGPGVSIGQVAARVRRSGVKLQTVKGEVL